MDHDNTAGSAPGHYPPTASLAAGDDDAAAAAAPEAASAGPSQPIAIQRGVRPPQQTVAMSVQPSNQSANASSMDPLSQTSKFRPQTARPDSSGLGGLSPTTDAAARFPSNDAGKDKRKGFLGRLSMRGSRRRDSTGYAASELDEPRTEGSDARVFSTVVDSAGYTPHHKEPPRYIRVKAHGKKVREFDRMFLAQELIGTRPPATATDNKIPVVTLSTPAQGRKKAATGGAVWATEFSKDGRYLAAGGRDHVVRVWAVIATADDRRAQEEEEAAQGGSGGGGGSGERLSAPVFREKPIQEFRGHTGEILDLSWSKNNFLLSTSMDKMVRLWHVSRAECLCAFQHKELVSKVAFHPRDDRFFLAGCLDMTLRLWSIPDKSVAFSAPMSDMITAVAFSPDGNLALAGLLNGFCYLLETEGLKPLTQIHVRSSRGRNAKGSKITGIVSMVPPRARPGDGLVLISSTDSRVRVYSLRDKTLDAKFKGHEHTSSQLFASFGDDAKHVICGSENGKVFIWDLGAAIDLAIRDKYPCEVFDAHADVVTTAVFAPTQTRQLLGASGDPIYDLCNPPPITLLSLEEAAKASQSGLSEDTTATAAVPSSPPPPPRSRPEESPAYIARSTHYDGNIIVTSDDAGIIKVFRQDCAADKRRQESWETGSTFSRKLAGSTGGLIARSSSLAARTSFSSVARSSSRRGSMTQAQLQGQGQGQGQGQAQGQGQGQGQAPPGGSSDRILSWRQGIEGHHHFSRPNSFVGGGSNGNGGRMAASARTSERSISPAKTSRSTLGAGNGVVGGGAPGSLASGARRQPYTTTMSSPLSSHFSVHHQTTRGSERERGAPSALGTATANGGGVAAAARPAPVSAPEPAPASAPSPAPAAVPVPEPPPPPPPPAGTKAAAAVDEEPDPLSSSSFGPPAPSLTFKSAPGDDTLRLDPAGASYSFWNLNKWRPIAGLRASLVGGSWGGPSSSGGDDTAHVHHHGDSHHHHHPHGHRYANGGATAATAAATTGEANGGGDASAAAATTTAEEGSAKRGRASLASGFLSHFAPSILVTDDNAASSSSSTGPGGGGGGRRSADNGILPSRSHSLYAGSTSVSRLSSEMTSSSGDDDGEEEDGGDDPGAGAGAVTGTGTGTDETAAADDEGDEMRCAKCGGREFKARRVGGVQQLQCSRCGKVVAV